MRECGDFGTRMDQLAALVADQKEHAPAVVEFVLPTEGEGGQKMNAARMGGGRAVGEGTEDMGATPEEMREPPTWGY